MSKIIKFIKEVNLFKEFTDSEIEKLSSLFTERKYARGTTIFFEGEEGNELYIVKSGKIKICRFNDEKEVTLSILSEGHFFGEMAVLQEGEVRSASAVAIESATLFVLRRGDFRNLIETKPQILIKLLDTTLNRLRKTNNLIKDLTTLDSRKRIYKTLLYLSEEYGLTEQDGIIIDIKLTHQQIADMSGTVRETVTKALLDLQNEGLITIDKKKIQITDVSNFKKTLFIDDL